MLQKSKCIIFDIDGTIAERIAGGRSPFDYTRVSEDVVNEPIKVIYDALSAHGQHQFIFLTGRDESCREQTQEWLMRHGINFTHLFMRPAGNRDLDVNIKTAIYREQIEPFFDVTCVFEDRERVCQMWRKHLGLTCLQVADGKF